MRITDKQVAAVEFIHRNPGTTVSMIATAAGASTSGSNDAEFLRRLIDSGLVQVVPTHDVRLVLDNDADDLIEDPAAVALIEFYEARHAPTTSKQSEQ